MVNLFNNYLQELKKRTKEIYGNNKLSPEEKDLLMIKHDWEIVGNDLKLALKDNLSSQRKLK